MSDLEKEALMNRRLEHRRPGRRFTTSDDVRWGELITPAPHEKPDRTSAGLRLVVFASFELGYLAVETVKAYERRFPDRLNFVGLVTDDPINPDAKIGVRKRLWKYFDAGRRLDVETATVEAGLSFGVPTYTGEIKTPWFRDLAKAWRPDAIIACGFGQIIDPPVINLPPLGIYNFHPSDLAHGHGAGPSPAEELAARGGTTSAWTVHQTTTALDAGPIIGSSPPVLVRDADGELPEQPLAYYNKMLAPLDYLVFFVVDALVEKFARKETGPLATLDFDRLFPESVKRRLLEPIRGKRLDMPLPVPDASLFL